MSRRNKNGPKLDLKLNLSPPPSQASMMSLVRSPSRSNTTSPSSCVSSDLEEMEATTSMILVGCPRCLMYVMLSQDDPKCPKCKSTVLLDILNQDATTATTAPAATTKRNKTWWNFFV